MFRYLTTRIITAFIAILVLSPVVSAAAMPAVTTFSATTTTKLTSITGVARVTQLRVHEGPSLRTKVLFHLTRGQTVSVLGVSANKRWLEIRSADGKVGWVSLFYTRLVGGKLSQLNIIQ